MNEIRADFIRLIEPLYIVSNGKNKVSEYLLAIRSIIDELDFESGIRGGMELFLRSAGFILTRLL